LKAERGAPLRNSLPSLQRLYERYGEQAVEIQLSALERHGKAVDDPNLWLEAALAGGFKFMPIEHVHRCPCGSTETTLLGRFVFWNLLGIRECDKCRLLFVSPRLSKEVMRSVFAEHYFDYMDLKVWGERRRRVFADVLQLLKSRGVAKVFDVGAAFGHFVKYAQERGLQAAGSDISAKAVEVGREQLGVDLHAGALADLTLPEESVDAVVSLDSFYYVADPRAELEAMRRLVKPGGIIVLRLRNSLWSRVLARVAGFRTIKGSALPAPHLWGFTPQSISHLLEVSGWRVEECQPAAYSISAFGPVQSVAIALNRVARRGWRGAPIFTRSFNVVARRVN
jgi:SAM-dependent methyltransferase